MSGAASSSMTAGLKSLPQNSVNHRPTTALLSSIDMGDAFLIVNWVGAHSGGTCYADGRESRLVRCGLGLACRHPVERAYHRRAGKAWPALSAPACSISSKVRL